MIVGVVGNREAQVEIEILDSSRRVQRVSAAVDTGYNGHLTLPETTIAALNLTLAGKRRAWPAGGSEVELGMYPATVLWHGRHREILASLTNGGPLLGMALLADNRLTIDVIDGGHVGIEPLGLSDT